MTYLIIKPISFIELQKEFLLVAQMYSCTYWADAYAQVGNLEQ